MKKSPIHYNPQSSQKNQVSRYQQGEARNDPSKNQSSHSALKYIKAAAKKFAGIITLNFLFKQRKAASKARNNGQIGVSSKLLYFYFVSNLRGSWNLFNITFLGFWLYPKIMDYEKVTKPLHLIDLIELVYFKGILYLWCSRV